MPHYVEPSIDKPSMLFLIIRLDLPTNADKDKSLRANLYKQVA